MNIQRKFWHRYSVPWNRIFWRILHGCPTVVASWL